ncbi:MAG: E3 binding domain-containing protein [Gemmataceae bacterium]
MFELGTYVTQEVAATVAGVLKILVAEGQTVEVGAVVAKIDTEAKAPAATASGGVSPESSASVPTPGPAAQRVLAEANLKPADVTGTGPGGRVLKEDAVASAGERGRQPPESPPTPVASTPTRGADAPRSPNRSPPRTDVAGSQADTAGAAS